MGRIALPRRRPILRTTTRQRIGSTKGSGLDAGNSAKSAGSRFAPGAQRLRDNRLWRRVPAGGAPDAPLSFQTAGQAAGDQPAKPRYGGADGGVRSVENRAALRYPAG